MDVQLVTDRKKHIDAAKGWGILMVVFGHITELKNPVDTWFSSYKLAIFFVVSGYLLCMRQSMTRYSLKEYLIKDFRSLIVPYLGFSILTMSYQAFLGMIQYRETDVILEKLWEQMYATFSFRGVSALWFLPALFVGQVLFFLIMKSPKWVKVISAIVPPLFAGYMSQWLPQLAGTLAEMTYRNVSYPLMLITRGVVAFWFIGAGYIAYIILSKFQYRYGRLVLGVLFFVGNMGLSSLNNKVDFNLIHFGTRPALFYVTGIVGSIGTLLVLEFLEKWWKMTFLTYCGKNSLVIMATHGTLGFKNLVVAGWKSIGYITSIPSPHYYVETICILVQIMLMECGVITVVEKYFPWLMGKYKKKEKNSGDGAK